MKGHPNAGFTLVELLVATLLLTLVMTAVYTLFSTVIQSWRSMEDDGTLQRKARHTQTLLQRDYANLFGAAGHLMEGTDNTLTFYVVAAPRTPDAGTTPRLLQVSYRFNGTTGELYRKEATVTAPLPSPSQTEADGPTSPEGLETHPPQVIARGLNRISFAYIWMPQPEGSWWHNAPETIAALTARYHEPLWGFPQAIDVHLEFASPEGGTPYETTLRLLTRAPNQRRERYQLENILGDAL